MSEKKLPQLTLVVPCFNEEAVVSSSAETLDAILSQLIVEQQVAPDSKILFVDDGSRDQTWSLICRLQASNSHLTGLRFSRNFGQEAALMAGLQTAAPYADLTITIDADLQDNSFLIPNMVQQAADGFDIVYGVRNDRSSDTWFKRNSAKCFYHLMARLGVPLIINHADYRLLSRRALAALLQYHESNPFLRGIVPQLGFASTKLYYQRRPRLAGQSKYSLRKMLKLALDGLFSSSTAPIHAVLWAGGAICLGAVGLLIWLLTQHQSLTEGTLMLTSLWFLGGCQLIAIGTIGEFVGRTFFQAKHRPRFIIQTDTYSQTFATNTKSLGHTLSD